MISTFIALLFAASPAAAQQAAQAVVTGQAGVLLTPRAAASAFTRAVDPELRRGRLSIRMVATNFGQVPAAFGSAAIAVMARGHPLAIATADELVGRAPERSQRASSLARASAAPVIFGFGQRDSTQDNSLTDAVMPSDRFARGDRIDGDYEARDHKRLRLPAALLSPTEVPPRGNKTGAVLTGKVPRDTKAVDIALTFAGTVHRLALTLWSGPIDVSVAV